jgi:hypothetical protein
VLGLQAVPHSRVPGCPMSRRDMGSGEARRAIALVVAGNARADARLACVSEEFRAEIVSLLVGLLLFLHRNAVCLSISVMPDARNLP